MLNYPLMKENIYYCCLIAATSMFDANVCEYIACWLTCLKKERRRRVDNARELL